MVLDGGDKLRRSVGALRALSTTVAAQVAIRRRVMTDLDRALEIMYGGHHKIHIPEKLARELFNQMRYDDSRRGAVYVNCEVSYANGSTSSYFFPARCLPWNRPQRRVK